MRGGAPVQVENAVVTHSLKVPGFSTLGAAYDVETWLSNLTCTATAWQRGNAGDIFGGDDYLASTLLH
jgi:hypothetical protein